MRKNSKVKKENIKVIQCNVCGKEIQIENDILKEDIFEVTKEWGYFSKKDLEVHKFNICEECYDKIVSQFKIPISIKNKKEAI